MQRSHTLLAVLTVSFGCGPSTERSIAPPPVAAQSTPSETQASPQLSDAGTTTPDALAPPKLTCTDGATSIAAPYPDKAWYCARADGVRHGPFVTLFPDLKIEITGRYVDGKLDGPWQRHHPGGAIAETGTYVAGMRDGMWRQLDEAGTVLGEYTLARGNGIHKRWLPDGSLYSETTLKTGVPHGPARIFDRTGAVIAAEAYDNGALDGKRIVGGKNLLRVEETYARGTRRGARSIWQFWSLVVDERYDTKGKLDGPFKLWRNTRTPRVHGAYAHGKRTGTWTWTDRGNRKEREGSYVDDKRTGTWSEWVAGKLVFRGSYADDRPTGEHVYYDAAGSELGRYTLTAGTGTALTFHANKRVATKTAYVDGLREGIHEELSPRGKRIVQGRFVRGEKHGVWRELTEAGQLVAEKSYKRGKLDGAWKKLEAGKLAVHATYKDGLADGAYTEYRNGKPALVGEFAADRRTGTWTAYNADGSVTLIATYKDGMLDGPWRQLANGVVVEGLMSGGHRVGTWTQTDRAGQTTSITYSTP